MKRKHPDETIGRIFVRFVLYPLIVIVIVLAAYGIFYMTYKEIRWRVIDTKSNLYNFFLYLSTDISLFFFAFLITLFKSSVYILFIFIGIFFLYKIIIKFISKVFTDVFVLDDFIWSTILFIATSLTIYFPLFMKTVKSGYIYILPLSGVLLAMILLYIISFELIIALELMFKINIEKRIIDRYKSFRRALLYISIAMVVTIYLELGIFTLFSYALGGINWQILQENMTFILFASLNIILLIDIFKKYF